jgi:serine protease AprX
MMLFRNQSIRKKIDPDLINSMRAMGNEKATVILYSSDGCQEDCRRTLERLEGKIKYELPLIQGYSVEIPYRRLTDLAALHVVKYIAADAKVKAQMDIAAKEIKADVVNRSGYTGKGMNIAIIDTGIFPHSDFRFPESRIIAFKDFVNKKKEPYDDNGHGTFVAGVAAGSGYLSRGKYKGVAPEAKIIALKSLDEEGGGSSSDILAAMQWVSDHRKEYNIHVLSLSLGSEVKRISSNDALVKGVEALWDQGITVVVAAGNSGPGAGTITSPGISQKAITVGAVDDKRTVDISDDEIADFSSRGPVGRRIKPDIVAPGVDIVSVKNDPDYSAGSWVRPMAIPYTTMSGTSVATPLVAGAALLLLQKNPQWTPDQVKSALMNHAINMKKDPNAQGKGIIDIQKCLMENKSVSK